MSVNVEVVAGATSVFAEEALVVGLLNSLFELEAFIPKFTPNVDVSGFGAHGEADDECAFDELMRVVSENLPIFASAGLRLVSVDHQIGRSNSQLL